ncbi:MAG: porphobilinogen synthase [Chitinispirillaceae bacterium]|nr:porphobilinogen synthase [Chitinispirillaceae bacterium]
MGFPLTRLRRLRANENLRAMVRETELSIDHFVMPLFVRSGKDIAEPIESMPNIFRLSIDRCVKECKELKSIGINSILLFGVSDKKDETGLCGAEENGVVQQAIRAIKDAIPEMVVITDVCNCAYTTHGHWGTVINGKIDNDRTLETLCIMALSHAKAGADMVAPSDMMDGRVGAIRKVLDENGFKDVAIMAYSAKYASAFYGPFRDAACSAPQFGDRRSYQMDITNAREAIRECALDLEEGADIIMVKPALSYLDIIYRVKEKFGVPVAAYNVSGEYSMVKAAAQKGWVDEKRIILEILTSIKRAGADIIISYHSKEVTKILEN